MKRLLAPARACGKLVLMYTDGKLDDILPILYDVGIDVNHLVEPESNDIFAVRQQWAGIPPENFMSMIRAVHKYGRYGSLGQVAASVN